LFVPFLTAHAVFKDGKLDGYKTLKAERAEMIEAAHN
jgi:hypothetical protein